MARRSSWRIEREENGECFVEDQMVWLLREHRFVMHVEPGWLSSGDVRETLKR